MKSIKIDVEDAVHEKLSKIKADLTWEEFLMRDLDLKPSLQDYSNMITEKDCSPCMKAKMVKGEMKTPLDIRASQIQHYDHDGGWDVKGFKEKQWLYVVCKKCKYAWNLKKLGVPT